MGGVLFGYFVYTPAPENPHLPGTLTTGSVDAGGLTRTYRTYVPQVWRKGHRWWWSCTALGKTERNYG